MPRTNVLILGAAGRDFHNFNTLYRYNATYHVRAFTAAQIPGIAGRRYPPELAGRLYPSGIPILEENNLEAIIREQKIDRAVFSYSDVSNDHVMALSARVNSAGAEFILPNLVATMLDSHKPVISIGAVRTGCGKSQTTRKVIEGLKDLGKTPVVVRHPMPYGDLAKQIVQRFASNKDLNTHNCTIEEREEYEPHIKNSTIVYAGVDYEKILRAAESEADVIVWDGGNNDIPFFRSNLHIVVLDPLRPGHELSYYPGTLNAKMADWFVVNKMNSAKDNDVISVVSNIDAIKIKDAPFIYADSVVSVDNPDAIRNKRVLVIEDGPTVTHGGMKIGAGWVAAFQNSAEVIDPKPYLTGSLRDVWEKYGHLSGAGILPAMGYGETQISELEKTVNAMWSDGKIDAVIIGTPINLGKLFEIKPPSTQVTYDLHERGQITILEILKDFFSE